MSNNKDHLVGQLATIQVAGEDENTELRTEFWITVIIVFLWTLILIGLLAIILILIFL